MRRRVHEMQGLASLIPLHSATDVPLQRQIYQSLRQAILSRQLPGGTRVPSSRALAAELDISRTTVFQAYQQLLLEGYLEGRRGSGTYVARALPDRSLLLAPLTTLATATTTATQSAPATPMTPVSPMTPLGPATQRGPGQRPLLMPTIRKPVEQQVERTQAADHTLYPAFRVGMPALEAFPHTLWQRLLAQNYRRSWRELFGYQEAAGYHPLREAIASYLAVARGVRCTYEQIIITSGTQQALDIIARVLAQAGDAVLMEDPGYHGARVAFQQAGLRLAPVPVERDGFDVAAGRTLAPEARLAYVTPSHQFPLGGMMSMERRLALLHWAAEEGGWIIEDDYDSEYRYVGRPLPALQGLDQAGRVLYLGSFSKMLFPSLRLGYLVVPPGLIETFIAARRGADLHSPPLEQAVVADFLTEGHFQRHIRRMRTLYAQRQTLLCELLVQHLPGLVEAPPQSAGMHLVAWLAPEIEEQQANQIVQVARSAGLSLLPLSTMSLRPLRRQALLLGYAAPNENQIAEGVQLLASIIKRWRMRHSRAVS